MDVTADEDRVVLVQGSLRLLCPSIVTVHQDASPARLPHLESSQEEVKLRTSDVLLHRATSCLLGLPLAAGARAAVGVFFLMEVRRMWEVLCR